MPKPKTMDLIDACRSPIRRQIMQMASEAATAGGFITAASVAASLEKNLSATSYHVKTLAGAGALECIGTSQHRGAIQRHYVASKAFQATMTDTAALDQIAEVAEEGISLAKNQARLFEIIRATGRPVEA